MFSYYQAPATAVLALKELFFLILIAVPYNMLKDVLFIIVITHAEYANMVNLIIIFRIYKIWN